MLVTHKEKVDVTKKECSFEERSKQIEKEIELEDEEYKRALRSNYKRWVQFNLEHSKELIQLASNKPKAYAILMYFIDACDKYNALMCSYAVLEELLGISKDTVRLAVNYLAEHNYIHIRKSGKSNIYCINPDLAWKSYGKNIVHCKFPAHLILTASEQTVAVTKEQIISVDLKELK